jgi:dolichol-phosphate mannosyltransferase
MRTLVVVPTYCEADNISELLQRVRFAMPDADVLVVDDGSPDGTADLARRLGQDAGQITVLDRPRKMGLGAAYRAGFAVGLERGYDVLVEMDADLSHDPAALPLLVDAVNGGAALAIGSRYAEGGSIPNWTRRRRWLSRWGNRYAAFALGISIRDATSGFRAYAADALRRAGYERTRANGYAFQIELTRRVARTGAIVEIPIVFSDRTRGESKMSLKITSEAMLLVTGWGLADRVRGRRRPQAQARGCPTP